MDVVVIFWVTTHCYVNAALCLQYDVSMNAVQFLKLSALLFQTFFMFMPGPVHVDAVKNVPFTIDCLSRMLL